MCGRAGRRGIDSSGNVYIICCEPLGKNQIKKIKDLLKGEGNELESKFRLSYRIILSFYHRNLKNINDFFQESFHENHNTEIKPEKLKEIEQIKDGVEKINKINCIIKDKVGWDIEESPIYKFVGMINEMDHINRKIFNNEKIIEYINSHPCSILQVKNNNNLTANKFHKPDIVMVVNIVKIKEMDKLWCITLTSCDESKLNSKKAEEIKNNEQIIQPIFSEKGQIQEFKYKYMLINFNDIIEIYDTPKTDKLETFYQKEKIKNYFNINEKGQYYFKDSPKILHLALKQLYRAILNHFPKKLSNIHGNKGPKKSDIFENGKAKVIDYKKIIGEESIKKSISKLKDYKAKIKNNPCQTCPRYEKHLNLYKVIKKEKSKIEKIEKQIKNGEKNEIQKKFNNRISLLRDLEYLQEDPDDNTGNDKYDNYTLTLKGKASLEIITNDNILITELLSSDIFYNNDKIISTQIIVSFLTIFVGNAKIKDIKSIISLEEEKYNEEAQLIKSKFFKIYNELIQKEENLGLKESVYNRSFSFKFFDSVFYWIPGNNFCDACEKYNIVEGKLYHIIIRTFYFSEEIYNFYTKLGNEKLASIFKDIKDKLLKGIMSVESLYIQENIDINDI
jgi:antiviral helicase SKI2